MDARHELHELAVVLERLHGREPLSHPLDTRGRDLEALRRDHR